MPIFYDCVMIQRKTQMKILNFQQIFTCIWWLLECEWFEKKNQTVFLTCLITGDNLMIQVQGLTI